MQENDEMAPERRLYNFSIQQPCLLLVEGKDDKIICESLAEGLKLGNLQIEDLQGKGNLKVDYIRLLVKTPGYENVKSLGLIKDADGNPEGAFQSICSVIRNANVGLSVPKKAGIPVGDSPKVIAMVVPETLAGDESGMIEDLCLRSVAEDSALVCVDNYFQCLYEQGTTISANKKSKARAQVFLASRKRPGMPIGEALKAGYWSWEHPAFDGLKDFLKKIVENI